MVNNFPLFFPASKKQWTNAYRLFTDFLWYLVAAIFANKNGRQATAAAAAAEEEEEAEEDGVRILADLRASTSQKIQYRPSLLIKHQM